MVERRSRLMQFLSSAKTSLAAVAVFTGGLASVGCGRYEPEPEYPQQYQYVAPTPPTAEELAARQQAAAESREVLVGADDDEYSDTDPSALTEFKPALDDHGTWVTDASYGTVWVPAKEEVGADFQPYVTAGHWTYSESTDYVWVSDYSWGWAPFHYGRWVHVSNHGWAWIPGRRYSGAWVTWRVGPAGYGYVGWAPAPPSWYWYNGYAYGWSFGWYDYHDHYVYCPHSHVYHHGVGSYVVGGSAGRAQHYGRTQDYVPARPGAGGGGDRVVANPSVGGGGRVVANPSVGGAGSGHVIANPGVKGPRPDELGMKDAVVAPPSSNQGISRAQALARPSTAIAAGAAAPAHIRPQVDPGVGASIGGASRGPATSAFVPGGARAMQPGSGPSISGSSGSSSPPSFGSSPSSAYGPSPRVSSSSPAYGASPSSVNRPGPSVTSPTFGSSPAMRSAPSVTSSPSFGSSPRVSSSPSFGSSPSYRSSPSVSAAPRSSPSFGSSPSFRSSPSVSSSPSFRSSAPAVRSSPSPSFRSSSPAVRSSPSVSSPSRSASPSRTSSPSVRSSGGSRRR